MAKTKLLITDDRMRDTITIQNAQDLVVAFDDAAEWVVPIQEVEHGAAISNTVSTLQDGGGTDILIGLQTAADQLVADNA